MNLMGKRVLVTGADGFIGSHLTEMLVKEAACVKVLSYYNSFNFWGWIEDMNCMNDIEVVTGDIRDLAFCINLTKNIDVIFHLAALIAIPYSYRTPLSYEQTNIGGTLNICQGALESNCERVIQTSTSEVYGTAKYVPIDEHHPLQPQSPYSASKIGADMIAKSYYHSFALPVTIVRPFNAFGPRQSARAVIPTIITQIAKNNKRIRLGDLSTTRDFSYVFDTCRGFLAIAKNDQTVGETFNIGSSREISIRDLFEKIKSLMNVDVEVVKDDKRIRPPKSEVLRLLCNNEKIENLTGFKPAYTLEQGLVETNEWFMKRTNLSKYKADLYNV